MNKKNAMPLTQEEKWKERFEFMEDLTAAQSEKFMKLMKSMDKMHALQEKKKELP